jgi:hypothetical protein
MLRKFRELAQEASAYLTFWPLLGGTAIVTFLSTWAASVTEALKPYAPFSWFAAGLLGLVCSGLALWLLAWGRARWIRAGYDSKMLARGSPIDPMQRTFENTRIYLNEFTLPSHPLIEGKTFIGCEIIGPANLMLDADNSIRDIKQPICDAVLLRETPRFYNGIILRRCVFRECSFQRITFFVKPDEYDMTKGLEWMNWVHDLPQGEMKLLGDVGTSTAALEHQSPQGSEEEKAAS